MAPSCVIALVEPYWIGHPETQLRLFTETLLQQKENHIVILCQYPEAIRSWLQAVHPEDANRCSMAPFAFCEERGEFDNPILASWALAHKTLLGVERSMGRPVDKVLITWLDPFICKDVDQVTTLMPRPWAGLYLFPSYLRKKHLLLQFMGWYPPDRLLLDKAFFTAPHCFGVAVLDEGVKRRLASVVSRARVHVLPDVPDSTLPSARPPLAQALLQKAAGRPIIGLLGVLGRRKGTLPFLRAMKNTDPARCFFLLAGRLGPEERRTYGPEAEELETLLASAKQRENALLHLEHLETEGIFNALVETCSALYLVYDDHHHSSGILGKAAYFRKPVISANKGCMAERVKKFGLGITICPGSDSDTLEAIHKLCKEEQLSRNATRADFDGYLAEHNPDRLKASLNLLLNDI